MYVYINLLGGLSVRQDDVLGFEPRMQQEFNGNLLGVSVRF